jgi:hypothetical protein
MGFEEMPTAIPERSDAGAMQPSPEATEATEFAALAARFRGQGETALDVLHADAEKINKERDRALRALDELINSDAFRLMSGASPASDRERGLAFLDVRNGVDRILNNSPWRSELLDSEEVARKLITLRGDAAFRSLSPRLKNDTQFIVEQLTSDTAHDEIGAGIDYLPEQVYSHPDVVDAAMRTAPGIAFNHASAELRNQYAFINQTLDTIERLSETKGIGWADAQKRIVFSSLSSDLQEKVKSFMQ